MPTLIRLALAAMLFLCFAPMPYGYYVLVRFAAMVGFGLLAYHAQQEGKGTLVIVYISLALLFQPFFKVALGRPLWNVVDVVVGTWLVMQVFSGQQRDAA